MNSGQILPSVFLSLIGLLIFSSCGESEDKLTGTVNRSDSVQSSSVSGIEELSGDFTAFLKDTIRGKKQPEDEFINALREQLQVNGVKPEHLGISVSPVTESSTADFVAHVYDREQKLRFAIFSVYQREGVWLTDKVILDMTDKPERF